MKFERQESYWVLTSIPLFYQLDVSTHLVYILLISKAIENSAGHIKKK